MMRFADWKSASPSEFMEKMLIRLALQHEGHTRLLGADAFPNALYAADHSEYLDGGSAHHCALVARPFFAPFCEL